MRWWSTLSEGIKLEEYVLDFSQKELMDAMGDKKPSPKAYQVLELYHAYFQELAKAVQGRVEAFWYGIAGKILERRVAEWKQREKKNKVFVQ